MTRGPLFQRALIVQNAFRSEVGSVEIMSAQFLSPAYFSYMNMDNDKFIKFTPEFKQTIINMYANATPYDFGHVPCVNGCTSTIKVSRLRQILIR
jgi:hypothetical protein